MALFDMLNNPQLAMAARILEMSGPSTKPVGFGQVMGGAYTALQQARQMQQEQEQQQQLQQMRALQMRNMQGDLDAEQGQRARAAQLGNAYKDFYAQGQQMTNPMAAITGPTLDQLPKLDQVKQEAPQALGAGARDAKLVEFLRSRMMYQEADALEKQLLDRRGNANWEDVLDGDTVRRIPRFQDGSEGKPSTYKNAVKMEFRDGGGTTDVFNPYTNVLLQQYTKTQSPESKANNALGWARLNQDIDKTKTDAQKPLPSSALKMQQAELEALGTAGGIQSELARVQNQIKTGKLDFGLVSNLGNQARNFVGMSNDESRNFASFKATMERLRNESLRLNAGVQTDGDAQRAWNELFANINDRGVVEQRLQEIQNLNARAAQLRKMNIDGIRANYGKDPLETSGYTAPTTPAGGGWSIERVK